MEEIPSRNSWYKTERTIFLIVYFLYVYNYLISMPNVLAMFRQAIIKQFTLQYWQYFKVLTTKLSTNYRHQWQPCPSTAPTNYSCPGKTLLARAVAHHTECTFIRSALESLSLSSRLLKSELYLSGCQDLNWSRSSSERAAGWWVSCYCFWKIFTCFHF